MLEAIKQKLASQLLDLHDKRDLTRQRVLKKDEFLLQQGDRPQRVFILLEGSVKVFHTTPKGNDCLMAIVGPGEILGEVEMLTAEPQLCSVQALWPCRVAEIDRQEYLCWLAEDVNFALLVNQVLCYRLQNCSKRAVIQLSYPLEYSVLTLLSQAAQQGGGCLTLSKSQIADYLGTSVRSVNRIMKQLQEQRLIAVDQHTIRLLSVEAVEQRLQQFEQA